jgi:type IV pilus assembly protein PilW
MTLVELLVAVLLSAVLMLGLIQLVTATTESTRLQDNQALLQERARFAGRLLRNAISEAGYRPQPWNDDWTIEAVTDGTRNAISARSDRLVVRSWSALNCFDNRNPDVDSDDRPLYYLRETSFERSSAGYLTRECRYGPVADQLTTQVRRQGLVAGVESFQLLFGEDSDVDGNIDQWVNAGEWGNESSLLGVRIGLAISSDDPVAERRSQYLRVLDARLATRADGRLRRVFEYIAAIRGRNG